MFTYSVWVTWMLYNHDNCRNIWEKRTWLNHVKSVKVTSGPFHSRGGVTIEVLPPVARRWPNGGIPPATCHPYPTSARRWANGEIPPATCHPYPTSARCSGAIWDVLIPRTSLCQEWTLCDLHLVCLIAWHHNSPRSTSVGLDLMYSVIWFIHIVLMGEGGILAEGYMCDT